MALKPGQLLHNRYEIIDQLGRGGMGAVYMARDQALEQKVAVKEMRPASDIGTSMLDGLRKQFQREARVLAGLGHSNLPRVMDYFTDGGNEYLVMDYIEGRSLNDVLKEDGRPGLPEAKVLDWARQLLDALEYIHKKNVLHRDIKPANIRLTSEGRVVLVDFGLVKLYDPNSPQTVMVLRGAGTPQYAPPEQIDNSYGHTDGRSDIFALGATLYYLLTGKLPPSITERIISQTPIPPISAHVPDVSPLTEAALLKAMQMRPQDRFQTAAEMRDALARVALSEPTRRPDSRPPMQPTYMPPSQPTRQPTAHPTPPPPVSTYTPPQPIPTYAPPPAPAKRGGIPTWGWVGGCGCLLAVGACIAFFVFGSFLPGGSTPTPEPVAIATETPFPSSPTPVPLANILYSDDFSDANSGWDAYDEEDSAVGYSGGQYFVEVRKDKFIVWEKADKLFSDVVIQVDANIVSGDQDTDYGLVCRYVDSDNFYMLLVAADGTAAIRKRQDGGNIELIHGDEWLYSDAINQGTAFNELKAVCDGSYLALYVNDVLVVEANDSTFSSGDVGLTAGTFGLGNVRVEFDNFLVQQP